MLTAYRFLPPLPIRISLFSPSFAPCLPFPFPMFSGSIHIEPISVFQLVNNCGSGYPVYISSTNPVEQGGGTVQGALLGGVAWLSGFSGAECGPNGQGCGIIEFTLINGGQSSADYSLQQPNGDPTQHR